MADEAQRALSQCDQVVIHDVQMQALQVRNFARNMDGKNLPLPARSRLGTDAKTLGDKAAFGRTLSVAHNRLVGTIMLDGYRKHADRLDISSSIPEIVRKRCTNAADTKPLCIVLVAPIEDIIA